MTSGENLSIFQVDVLQEISNIGVGNAATALSQMLNRRIEMNAPKAGFKPFGEIYKLVGPEEELVSCVNFTIRGEINSQILFLLTKDSSFALLDLLLERKDGVADKFDSLAQSALQETGNILCGSFLNALSKVTGLTFKPSVPAFAFDMLGAVLSSAFVEGGCFGEQALIIETEFYQKEISINGHFFLIPEPECLGIIFKSLGLDFDGGMQYG